MARTAPVVPTEVPGNFWTSALFMATVAAIGAWQVNVPRFKGYATALQAIGSGTTFLSVNLDSELTDPDGGHSTVSNTSRYVVQVPGWYWVHGSLSLPSGGGAGNRALQLAINGATANGATAVQSAAGANSWGGIVMGFLQLAAGDYVELQVWQNSGGSLNTTVGGGLGPSLSLTWMSN